MEELYRLQLCGLRREPIKFEGLRLTTRPIGLKSGPAIPRREQRADVFA